MTTFKRYFFSLSLAALGFLTILVISVLVLMNSLYYEINITGLKNAAKAIMAVVGEDRIAQMYTETSNLPEKIFPSDAFRVTLIAPSGYVLWDSGVEGRMPNHIDREEVKTALEGGEAVSLRNSVTLGTKLLYYALPIMDSSQNLIGVFRLSKLIPGFEVRFYSFLFPFFIFILILAAFALWAVFVFSRSLSSSLSRLAGIAQAGSAFLSGMEENEKVAPEFRSLEKTIQAFVNELNFRLERTRSEGRRLEAILNGMSEAVIAVDYALKLHLVNPRARKLFNLSDRNIASLSLLEATHSTELVEIVYKALGTNTALEKELSLHVGTEQYYQVLASPLDEENKKGGGGVVLVLQDITKLKKLERVRKDFVANVSHELRTPIQLIKGFSETLLDTDFEDDKTDKKKIIHFVEIINKNAGVMETLTNDLLILADLENNNYRAMDELNVATLIDEAISSLDLQANKKDIKIIADCQRSLKANLFGSFIIQALINLIDNGIKYSPAKSKLWVNARKENKELIIEVRDKGIGISAEHLERIFERFYRVDRSRSRENNGSSPSTGLGLSIVRHIALLHKGTVEAESHAGEGSVFRLRLPQV